MPNNPPALSLIAGESSPASKLYLAKNTPPKAKAIAPIQVIQFCSKPARNCLKSSSILDGFLIATLGSGVCLMLAGL